VTTAVKMQSDGRRTVRWGRDAWQAIAEGLQPRLKEVKADMPVPAFARLVFEAQLAVLPEDIHRPYDSLVAGSSPSSNHAVQKATMAALKRYAAEARAAARREQAPRSIAEPTLRVVPPPPKPVAQEAPRDHMQALMDLPVSHLAPIVTAMLRQALKGAVEDVMAPLVRRLGDRLDELDARLDAIQPAVRHAIEDALGAPTPAPETALAAPEPAPAETAPAPVVAHVQVEESTPPPVVAHVRMEESTPPQMLGAAVIPPDTPHDLTTQMELAAKALGMPHVKRLNILVCGLHPKVMEMLEREHGRRYRFTFVKQDHFNSAADLPASTDGLLLSRKKLGNELMGAVRRYAIPWRTVANSLAAAEWGLSEMFPPDDA
jgi:hypothetical protein